MTDEIRVGQIWRELDPRTERHVSIEAVAEHTVAIRTVVRSDGQWAYARPSYTRDAARARFNGRRGGYELVEEGGHG
jgi:hypothetical protein